MQDHPSAAAELPIVLDRASEIPLPVQLAAALREAIDGGTLRPGEPLAATRAFARRLGVARGVVVAAYEQLVAEGYLAAGQGKGTRVDPGLRQPPPDAAEHRSAHSPARRSVTAPDVQRLRRSEDAPERTTPGEAEPLAPGVPDTTAVDTPAWRSAWRRAVARAHLEAPELGDPMLRGEIAEHLRRMRGTARSAADVIVTAGTREGLGLLLTALGTTGGRRLTVGVEDPGYPSLRLVAARHGADIVALPVDAHGLDTASLPDGLLDVVIVTPSHQYPLGGSLPLVRRRELLAWASRTGVVIVEDDYDSELRHSGAPLPALAALDDPVSGSVVLLGTFSKTVSQSLSAGFLLASEGLRALIEPVRRDLGGPVPAVVQRALAGYLGSGELRRHTARMRRRYAIRREAVLELLHGLPGVSVRPMSGGLHAVIQFSAGSASPGELDPEAPAARSRASSAAALERHILAEVAAAGLGAVPLSRYWQRRGPAGELFGLVIGTGGRCSDAEFADALRRLREILRETLGKR